MVFCFCCVFWLGGFILSCMFVLGGIKGNKHFYSVEETRENETDSRVKSGFPFPMKKPQMSAFM